jgi:hypothetical protein
VLSRRVRAPFFDRTGRFKTAIALQKKLSTFAAAQAAHRISISSHIIFAFSKNESGSFAI